MKAQQADAQAGGGGTDHNGASGNENVERESNPKKEGRDYIDLCAYLLYPDIAVFLAALYVSVSPDQSGRQWKENWLGGLESLLTASLQLSLLLAVALGGLFYRSRIRDFLQNIWEIIDLLLSELKASRVARIGGVRSAEGAAQGPAQNSTPTAERPSGAGYHAAEAARSAAEVTSQDTPPSRGAEGPDKRPSAQPFSSPHEQHEAQPGTLKPATSRPRSYVPGWRVWVSSAAYVLLSASTRQTPPPNPPPPPPPPPCFWTIERSVSADLAAVLGRPLGERREEEVCRLNRLSPLRDENGRLICIVTPGQRIALPAALCAPRPTAPTPSPAHPRPPPRAHPGSLR